MLYGIASSCRVLFSSDQSFPLAGAFAYSVYQFQSKRVKRNPDGPFFGGNAIVGAIFSTLCCLAVACAVSLVKAVAVLQSHYDVSLTSLAVGQHGCCTA